jgi:hypothetical protein
MERNPLTLLLGGTMDYSNLEILAEVSVALLGFSGLTIVLGRSRFNQHGVSFRIRGLLFTSSAAFVGSTMPLVGMPLLASILLLALTMSIMSVWSGRETFGRQSSSIQTNPILFWALYPPYVLSMLALWLSPLLMPESNFAVLKFAIGLNLLLAVTYFVRLILSMPTDETSSGP